MAMPYFRKYFRNFPNLQTVHNCDDIIPLSQVSTVPVNTEVDESEVEEEAETGRKWKKEEGGKEDGPSAPKKGEWRLGWQVGEVVGVDCCGRCHR